MNEELNLLSELQSAAVIEDWQRVDRYMGVICDLPSVIKWAISDGLEDDNGNLRDLAVSLLEKTKLSLDDSTLIKLSGLMDEDENIYVQYRSAFALYNHGDRSDKVVAKLRQALNDKDVAEIANNYLKLLC